MKKLLFFLMILCVQNLNAQTQKTREGLDKGVLDCPPGNCSILYIDIEIQNFHTKRSGCEEGFGFCGRLDLGFICKPCIGKSVIDNGKISVYGKKNDQSIELHFTQEIQHEKGFENADFSDFELEDNMLSLMSPEGKTISVPGGNYPVKKIDNEYVVEIAIK
jgi:hypothetical protein